MRLQPLAVSLVLAALGCGRNGPLQPWPAVGVVDGPSSPSPDLGVATNFDLGPPPPDLAPPPVREWQWVSPSATGNPLAAIGGTSANDIWLAGAVGTILHFDGSRFVSAHAGGPNDRFTAVAAGAPDDVWIAGETSQGSIMHFDGSSWTAAFALSSLPIHALDADPQYAHATVDDNGVGEVWTHTPNGYWYAETSYGIFDSRALRDVFAIGDAQWGPLFAVGDAGAVLWRPSTDWTKGTPGRDGGADDPFTSDKNYFGVWGASAGDVWAAFVAGTTVGFSHFDGTTWTVKQTLPASCVAYQKPYAPFDRGKRVVGLDANNILATAADGCAPFLWNGSTWAELGSLSTQTGYALALAGFGGRWYGAAPDGQLLVSNNDLSWSPLPAPTRRDTLPLLSVTDDAVWSAVPSFSTNPTPLRWSSAGWSDVPLTITPNSFGVNDVFSLGADDLWMTGMQDSQGAVTHFDGKTWSTPVQFPGLEIYSVWASSDNDVWLTAGGAPGDDFYKSLHVIHFNGSSWNEVAVPSHPSGVVAPSVFGLRSDAVWFTSHIYNTLHRFVWKWDGTSIQQVAYTSELDFQSWGPPWASSDNDVWIPAQPVIHWDGTSWSAITSPPDFAINSVWGTRPGDVWGVGAGPFGGAIWHYQDGVFVDAFDVAPRLYAIRGGKTTLPWAVGANGATLRLVDLPRAP